MKLKIKQIPYYNFNHEKVNNKFKGDLTFCNEFCVNNEYNPVAVYHAKNPDTSKGHKEFMLLQAQPHGLVRGMDAKEMNKWKYQEGIYCKSCKEVLYSVHRHDFNTCSCGNVSIDGGRDYTKISSKENASFKIVKLNLITNKVLKIKK